jgi:hypothetical protein
MPAKKGILDVLHDLQRQTGLLALEPYGVNGNKLADSGEGYVNKRDCKRGIDLVKSSSTALVYEE